MSMIPGLNLGLIGADSSMESAPPLELAPNGIKFGFVTLNLFVPQKNIIPYLPSAGIHPKWRQFQAVIGSESGW